MLGYTPRGREGDMNLQTSPAPLCKHRKRPFQRRGGAVKVHSGETAGHFAFSSSLLGPLLAY